MRAVYSVNAGADHVATLTISFRASPDLYAELDAVAKQAGKTTSAVVTEFVQSGLAAMRAGAAGPTGREAESLRKILEGIDELRAGAKAQRDTIKVVRALKKGLADLPKNVVGTWAALAGPVLQDGLDSTLVPKLEEVKKALRSAVGNFITLGFPELPKEEVREHVKKIFET